MRLNFLAPVICGVGLLLTATQAQASFDLLPSFPNDEAYTRLIQWESHIDDRMAQGVQNGSLNAVDAYHLQRDLGLIVLQTVSGHYMNGHVSSTVADTLSDRLRRISQTIRDRDWENGPPQYRGDHGDRGDRGGWNHGHR